MAHNSKQDALGGIVICGNGGVPLKDRIPLDTWKALLRKDCEMQGKLIAFDALGDYVLQLLWTRGLDPTVKAIIECSPESQDR